MGDRMSGTRLLGGYYFPRQAASGPAGAPRAPVLFPAGGAVRRLPTSDVESKYGLSLKEIGMGISWMQEILRF